MNEGVERYTNESECIKANGTWIEDSCEVVSEFGCYHMNGQWTPFNYEILDLGDGQYIRIINSEDGAKPSFICGTYNAVVTEKDAKTCTSDKIEKFKRALEYHLCTADASNCVPPFYPKDSDSIYPKDSDSTLSENAAMCSECPLGMAQCLKDNKYQCVDLMSDTMNCGSCGNDCGGNKDNPAYCEEGFCHKVECKPYEIQCSTDNNSWYCLDGSVHKSSQILAIQH